MTPENKAHPRPYFDIRLKLFALFKRLALLTIIVILVKYLFIDTYSLKTDILTPFLKSGDRILVSRLSSSIPFKAFFKPDYGERLIFPYPLREDLGIMRMAGKSGDTISIKDCSIENSNNVENYKELFMPLIKEDPLSGEYSPRDNMESYIIPKKGDTLVPPTMSIRDIIYTYSIISRENPSHGVTLKRELFIDDSLSNDYLIKEFYRYTGKFSDIPDSLFNDYLFWEQLATYFNKTLDKGHPNIRFTIANSKSETYSRYTVKDNYYFMISDNWDQGMDSRYFGPIGKSEIKGSVFLVLWSISREKGNIFKRIKTRRILKFIGKQGLEWQK